MGAEQDSLTGLGNPSAFLRRGAERVASRSPFVLVLANVDHLKAFNGHNGHEAGDDVLRRIAEQLHGFEAFRIDGDTFGVFATAEAEAEVIRRRVADRLNPPQVDRCEFEHCRGPAPAPRVSLGVCAWRDETFESCLRRARDALFRAKESGRNRVELA